MLQVDRILPKHVVFKFSCPGKEPRPDGFAYWCCSLLEETLCNACSSWIMMNHDIQWMLTFRHGEVASRWLGSDSRVRQKIENLDPSPLPSQAFLKIRALSCWKVSCSCVPHGNKLVQYTLIISLVVHFSSAYFPSLWLKEREISSLVQLGRNKKITRPAGSTTPLSIQSWHGLQAG